MTILPTTQSSKLGAAALGVLFILLAAAQALAYPQYSANKDATYCRQCHGDFRANNYVSPHDGQNWGNLHDLHRQTMLNGDCNVCHGAGRFPAILDASNGGGGLAPIACMGCHGRAEDDTAANPLWPRPGAGAGLRQHHARAGVTACAACHADANPANYTPVGEDVLPPYYASPGTGHPNIPSDPCNPNGVEDFAGATEGTDNDGDDLYDGSDPDCTPCGNGTLDPGETCDPPATCPTSCDDGVACTVDTMTGQSSSCNVVCTNTPIAGCAHGDSCCPSGCTAGNDNDCSAACGNGALDPGETCDPPATCPTTCDDGDACSTDVTTGSAANCNVACTSSPITSCADGDGCCPGGCNALTDNNCAPVCGNNVVEAGEACDPCPTSCSDGEVCTEDNLTGSAATCDVVCANPPITLCTDGDGCCPAGCDAVTDSDCAPICGNNVTEPGETCDPCPTSCDDSNTCTEDNLTGSAATCDVACANPPITLCADGDGCCPNACDELTDTDCVVSCGDGVLQGGETCDPPASCPTTCDDGDACTTDTLTGSAATCDAACANNPITTCANADGCCPTACTAGNDDDCAAPPNNEPGGDSSGCACAGSAGVSLWLLGLALGGLRRRREWRS